MADGATNPKTRPRILRPTILWTAALLAGLGLTWFAAGLVVPYLQARAAVRTLDASQLGSPEQAVEKLTIYLKVSRIFSGEGKNRADAAFLLRRALGGKPLGTAGTSKAVLFLVALLKDKDARVRDGAAEALGDIGPAARNAIPALEAAVKDRDESVGRSAAIALSRIDGGVEIGKAVLILMAELEVQDAHMRLSSAKALGHIGPEAREAVPALVTALKDADEKVRCAAAWALGEIGPEARAAISALEAALNYEEGMIQGEAKKALEKIRGAPANHPSSRS